MIYFFYHNEVFLIKTIILLCFVVILLFLVACIPSGQAVFQGCKTMNVVSCTEEGDDILFRGGHPLGLGVIDADLNVRISRGLCSEDNKAYQFSCSSPTALQYCTTKCDASEVCDAGVCRPEPKGCVAEQWTKVFEGEPGGSLDWPNAIDVSDDGTSIYIVGSTIVPEREISSRIYISKLDACGNMVWTQNLQAIYPRESNGQDIIVDANNKYVYVVGYSPSPDFFEPFSAAIVVQLNAVDGSPTGWFVTIPNVAGRGITIDTEDNIYIIGTLSMGEITNDESGSLMEVRNSSRNYDIFLAKYSLSTIEPVWSQIYSSPYVPYYLSYWDGGEDLTINQGYLYLTGTVTHPFGDGGIKEFWLAKANPADGTIIWSITDPPERFQITQPRGIAHDSRGNLWVTGTDILSHPIDPTIHDPTIFLRLYNAEGRFLNAWPIGEEIERSWYRRDEAYGIAVSPVDDVLIVGEFDIDRSPGTEEINNDIFVHSLRGWEYLVDYAGNEDEGRDVAIDGFGNGYVLGYVERGSGLLPNEQDFWIRKYRSDGFYR